MSSLKTGVLLREFYYNGVRIPDPGPELSVEQIRDLLTPNYPEIAIASVAGPEDTGSALRYTLFGAPAPTATVSTPVVEADEDDDILAEIDEQDQDEEEAA